MTDNQDRQISGSMPLFTGSQRINPDVLKPDNLRHDTALTALREIGNGLEDRGFANIRARQLFPPPKPVPEELRLFGTRDWVFFHRRRDITCGHDEVPEVAVKPLRYRLYYVNSLNSKEEFELLRSGLLDNNGAVISRFEPTASSIVEYDAGLSSVRTSHLNLRNDWQTLVNDPNARVILGAIGSRGAAFDEGAAMAQLRLESVSDLLEPITPVDEDATLFTLPAVPDVLAEGSVDGVIVLASVSEAVDTICHQVYRVELELADIDNFSKSLQYAYHETLERNNAQLLKYSPLFIDKTSDFTNAEVEKALEKSWLEVGNTQPQFVFSVTGVDATGAVVSEQPYLQQAKRIASSLGSDAETGSQFIKGTADIGACPGVSILVTTPLVQQGVVTVHAHSIEALDPIGANNQITEMVQKSGYQEWLGSPEGVATSMGIVSFDENNLADATNLDNLKEKAVTEGFIGGDINYELFIQSISKKDASATEREQDKTRAEQINKVFGSPQSLTDFTNSSTIWGNEGTSSVLMVAIQQVYLFSAVAVISDSSGWEFENPEDLVTEFKNGINVDESGNVSKDAGYEKAIKALAEKGELVKNIEIVGLTATAAKAEKIKAEAILTEMKAAGVAIDDAKILTRKANAAEREIIKSISADNKTGMIMTK